MSLQFDTSYNWHDFPEKTKDELSKVSSSFCLAKWAQSTIHFQLGRTHSCHNLATHEIPLPLPSNNLSALHNTPTKMKQRALMLKGEQHSDCSYCWNVENLKSDTLSERLIQSSSSWASAAARDIYESGLGENFNPRYLEVSFSSACQFKCSYCSGQYSSSWAEEIRLNGPYSTGNGQRESPLIDENENPYIEAFHQWWPTLKNDLRVFRITGGEPLLSKNTWALLDSIEQDPVPQVQLAINSNLGVSDALIEKLIHKLKSISDGKKVKELTLFTSIEAMGSHADYIRYGLEHQKFFNNVEKLLSQIPKIRITFMATFCALSVFSYLDLLKKVISLRQKFHNPSRPQRVGLSTSYLRNPEHLTVDILPENFIHRLQPMLEYMQSETFHLTANPSGFTKQEISMFENLKVWMGRELNPEHKRHLQKMFKQFFTEHDLRRGTNILHSVPEITEFWNSL